MPPIPDHYARNFEEDTEIVHDLLGNRFKVVKVAEESIAHSANLMDKDSLDAVAETVRMITQAFGQKELNPFSETLDLTTKRELEIRTLFR